MKKKKILVMDDEEMIRKLLKEMAEAVGHECFSFSNGEEVLKASKIHSFDLALLDLENPGIGGAKTAERMKKDFPDKKIILMSGNHELLEEEGRKLELQILPKPISLSKLEELLNC